MHPTRSTKSLISPNGQSITKFPEIMPFYSRCVSTEDQTRPPMAFGGRYLFNAPVFPPVSFPDATPVLALLPIGSAPCTSAPILERLDALWLPRPWPRAVLPLGPTPSPLSQSEPDQEGFLARRCRRGFPLVRPFPSEPIPTGRRVAWLPPVLPAVGCTGSASR